MATSQGNVLEVLQSELAFLESGGYKWCMERPWRPPLAFVESRTCPRHNGAATSCEACALTQFVPVKSLREKRPCWHIPLNEADQTLDSLYQWGTEDEINQSLKTWLWSTTLSIEEERRAERIARRRQGSKSQCEAPAACACDSK